jgi:hypothetical protein
MHRGQKRQDSLQNAEQKGQQPAGDQQETEQRRPVRSRQAIKGGKSDEQCRRQQDPGGTDEKKRLSEALAHAALEHARHQPQMQGRGAKPN